MNKKELEERGFSTDKYGKVLDDFGNEYRNEDGEVEFLDNESTLFEIDICGDCAEYPDCSKKDKFNCEYVLTEQEIIERFKAWYRLKGKINII